MSSHRLPIALGFQAVQSRTESRDNLRQVPQEEGLSVVWSLWELARIWLALLCGRLR